MKFYKVCCVIGHLGRGYRHATMTFAFRANNIMEASDKARMMPMVKHHKSYAVVSASEIDYEEYSVLRSVSAYQRTFQINYKRKRVTNS